MGRRVLSMLFLDMFFDFSEAVESISAMTVAADKDFTLRKMIFQLLKIYKFLIT